MAKVHGSAAANVERFPNALSSISISEGLNKILDTLRQGFPDAAQISLDFDGKLHAHIDVRQREQVTLVEATLPTMGGGMFHGIKIGGTPNHPFLHRVSALVEV